MTEQVATSIAVESADSGGIDDSIAVVSAPNESTSLIATSDVDKSSGMEDKDSMGADSMPDSDKPSSADDDVKKDGDKKKKKKAKPQVLKERQQGIYTIQELEAANFFVEWYKGLRASAPYIARLTTTFWSLSPGYSSVLIGANLLKVALPSFQLWIRKEFLDQVQQAAEGKSVHLNKLLGLLVFRIAEQAIKQGLELTTDKIDAIMERRLGQILDLQLVEAYLKLDTDQLSSRQVASQFNKAKAFANRSPSSLVVQWIDFVRYILTIVSSTYTLSRLMSKNATQLLLLNGLKMVADIYRLIRIYSGAVRYRVLNKAWHRLNLMKGFSLNESLRRDISVTGLESWLTSEMTKANAELGDTSTRPPWHRRASSTRSFARYLVVNFVDSLEYIWLIYQGLKKGMSLGTLHLIRSSASEVVDMLWNLSYTADNATEEWKNLVAFYRCLELKSQMQTPEDPEEYVSQPAGMKIEARNICYKYNVKDEEEVLKGTSFVINPGEMIAVVGFNGAGKSTLAKLLTRLANVTGGELLVNDVDVKRYDPATLRRHIAVLFQDIGQYQGLTILENIGVGKVSDLNSTSVVHQSASDAGAAEFIDQLPHKYDSFLGFLPGDKSYGWGVGRWEDSDSGSEDEDEEKKVDKDKVQKNLSGGQWQKIALARAFMRGNEADLLVLDEPTANLDPEAEYKLFETIKRLRKSRTTVYISHRFNTVRAADRIMVMEKGEVKEFGTHEELMAMKEGRYHRLYTLQANGFLFDDKGGVSKDVDGLIVDVKEDVIQTVIDASE